MEIQTKRNDVDDDHIKSSILKLAKLAEQRHDITQCFDRLILSFINGSAYFKIYRQFKMYNDPKTNPYLYMKKIT
jgi:hypothetical protein